MSEEYRQLFRLPADEVRICLLALLSFSDQWNAFLFYVCVCVCVGPCSRFQLCLSREYSSPGNVFISFNTIPLTLIIPFFLFCRVTCTSSFIISAFTLTSLAMRPRYSLLHHSFIPSFLHFLSSLFVLQKIIPFADISCVKRAKTAGIFPNAIEILAGGKKVVGSLSISSLLPFPDLLFPLSVLFCFLSFP